MSAPLSADDALYRVVEISGQAEIFDGAGGNWRPLEENARILAGSKLRTGRESGADLVRDAYFENALRIGPSSVVTFLSANPVRVSLDEGSVYILKEEHHELRILTKDFLVSAREGGFKLDFTKPASTMLKVFADSVQIFKKTPEGYSHVAETVEEGFRFTPSGRARMNYEDYLDWQAWCRKNDERKDQAWKEAPVGYRGHLKRLRVREW